jgi:outer membrane protein assembly factor BamB
MKKNHIMAILMLLCASPVWAQDWPQWRGPNRDNHVVGFNAPKEWPKELTKKWKVTVGIGEASPALVGDKVYTFGRIGGDEVTICLDAATGKEIWKDKYAAAKITGPAGGFTGPRSTIAVGDGKVCTLGVHGVVSCFDAATGKIVWRKENTGKVPGFQTSTSPMVVDGMCVVYVGVLTAYDLASGDVKWKWSGGGPPYGSPILMTVEGTKQVVTPAAGGSLAGINLADGKLLWQVKVGGGGGDYQSSQSTPISSGNKLFYSAAAKGGKGTFYGFKIEKNGTEFKASELWNKSGSADKYHSPLLKDDMIYGVSSSGRSFFCIDAKTGEKVWSDDKRRGECGCILDAGPVLIALTSDKQLIAFEPGKTYKEVAKYQVSDSETWSVPIIAGNRVFVKDKGGSLTLWTIE